MKNGTVQWFDKSSGEGFVYDDKNGISYYVHYSAIDSNDPLKILNKGDTVTFKLYTNLYMSQVDYVKVV